MTDGTTKGTFQHYVPAAFLGRFSSETSKRARKRGVWVVSNDRPGPRLVSAAKEAGQYGLYDFEDESELAGGTVDVAWGYEQGLREALDALIDERPGVDGALWVKKLVPFIAALFVRGPEFQHEYPSRLPSDVNAQIERPIDGATRARLIDFQVLLAPVMAARWAVVHFPEHVELITSDRGYALTATPVGQLPSYVIPVDRHTAAVVTPRPRGAPLSWTGNRWVFSAHHFDAPTQEADGLNRVVAAYAGRAVYGATEQAVEAVSEYIGAAPRLTAGLFEALDPASHLYDYFRVLAALLHPPNEARRFSQRLDWKLVASRDWTAAIAVELLFTDRTAGGVVIRGDRMWIDLTYGIELRRQRRASGDFRMGALGLVDLDLLRQAEPSQLNRTFPPTRHTG